MQIYNQKKMDELLRERSIPRKVLKQHVARVKNDAMLKELVEGNEKIGVDQLLAVVNFLGVSVSDFFLEDGRPIGGVVPAASVEEEDGGMLRQLVETERTLYKERAQHSEEVHQLVLQHERELSKLREGFLEKMADLRVELATAQAKLDVETREFNLNSRVYHGYEHQSIVAEDVQ